MTRRIALLVLVAAGLAYLYWIFPLCRTFICEPTRAERLDGDRRMIAAFLLGAGTEAAGSVICQEAKPLSGSWSCRFPLDPGGIERLVNVWRLSEVTGDSIPQALLWPGQCCVADNVFCREKEAKNGLHDENGKAVPSVDLIAEESTRVFAFPPNYPRFPNSDHRVSRLLTNSARSKACIEILTSGEPD